MTDEEKREVLNVIGNNATIINRFLFKMNERSAALSEREKRDLKSAIKAVGELMIFAGDNLIS